MVFDFSGNLYGATEEGGRNNTTCPFTAKNYAGCGTIFRLSPTGSGSWNETILYQFTGRGDGSFPVSGVTLDGAGDILTTTTQGGATAAGTVFELVPQLNNTSVFGMGKN